MEYVPGLNEGSLSKPSSSVSPMDSPFTRIKHSGGDVWIVSSAVTGTGGHVGPLFGVCGRTRETALRVGLGLAGLVPEVFFFVTAFGFDVFNLPASSVCENADTAIVKTIIVNRNTLIIHQFVF
jgi:hypothetical protein